MAVPDSGPLLDLDSGPDSGPDGGSDAGDGGYHSDSGCEIRGEILQAGDWLNVQNGSCTYCDPALNPNGWTVLDSGQPCQGFARQSYMDMSYPTVPFEGVCFDNHPYGTCGGAPAGSWCNLSQGFGCQGGFCNAAGWCEVTQNLGWFTACGVLNAIPSNACADGPCCWDGGGYAGVVPDGGGWCCGLIDGGVSSCLPDGGICVLDSNCCAGLRCVPPDAGRPPGGPGSTGICE